MKEELARSRTRRRAGMRANRARGFEEARQWDLEFWLSHTSAQRLEALESMRREWEEIRNVRDK